MKGQVLRASGHCGRASNTMAIFGASTCIFFFSATLLALLLTLRFEEALWVVGVPCWVEGGNLLRATSVYTLASRMGATTAACDVHARGMYRSRMLLHYTGRRRAGKLG